MKKTTKPSPRSIAVLESAELRAVMGGSGNATGRRSYKPVDFDVSPPPPPPPPPTNG